MVIGAFRARQRKAGEDPRAFGALELQNHTVPAGERNPIRDIKFRHAGKFQGQSSHLNAPRPDPNAIGDRLGKIENHPKPSPPQSRPDAQEPPPPLIGMRRGSAPCGPTQSHGRPDQDREESIGCDGIWVSCVPWRSVYLFLAIRLSSLMISLFWRISRMPVPAWMRAASAICLRAI